MSVERALNIGRDVIALRRASLSAETIRMLMVYRAGLLLDKRLASVEAKKYVKKRKHRT